MPTFSAKAQGASDVLAAHNNLHDQLNKWSASESYHDVSYPAHTANIVGTTAQIWVIESENSIRFSSSLAVTSYAGFTIEVPHSWSMGSAAKPHLHWWQNSTANPNWILQYRWNYYGQAKATTWAYTSRTADNFSYTAGTGVNQITSFTPITPTTSASINDFLQFRVIRDCSNQSSKFGSTDALAGTVDATIFGVHFECGLSGSAQEFVK